MNNKKTIIKKKSTAATTTIVAAATIIAIVASAAMILGVPGSQMTQKALAESYNSYRTKSTTTTNSRIPVGFFSLFSGSKACDLYC